MSTRPKAADQEMSAKVNTVTSQLKKTDRQSVRQKVNIV